MRPRSTYSTHRGSKEKVEGKKSSASYTFLIQACRNVDRQHQSNYVGI